MPRSRRRRRARLGLLVPLLLAVAVPSIAAGSPESEKRKELLEKLGIDKSKTKPKPPRDEDTDEEDVVDTDAGDDTDEGPDAGDDTDDSPAAPSDTGPRITYRGKIHRMLKSGCQSCHRAGGSAGATKFVLTGSIDADYKQAKRFVKGTRASASPLVTKATGSSHAGGAVFRTGGTQYRALKEWIEAGSPKGGGSTSAAPTPAPAPVVTPTPTPSTTPTPTSPPKRPRSSKPTPTTAEPTAARPAAAMPRAFAPDVHDVLLAKCQSCHKKGAIAGNGAFVLSGSADTDYATTVVLVDPADPPASRLLSKATGHEHGGGPTLTTAAPEYEMIRAWIADGAHGPTAADIEVPATTDGSEPTEDLPVDATTKASPPPATGDRLGDGTPLGQQTAAPSALPFGLPYHLHLNGKLDFSYERRDYRGQPFGPGRNQFQTYHHFLFLSRAGADDPFGFNVELITQSFYEFNARIAPKKKNFDFLFKAGKILVPFGPEPIFHKSYGGRSGFDQEILPLIWAQPGVAGTAHVRAGPVALSGDLYTVQGYALREQDAILNLQSDLSSLDDFKAAFGTRIGVSWRPLTGWYSAQFNRLGFDRLLFMQAVDLEFWRLADVVFLEDVVLGVGGMRADVSGGGPGQDYYHFGSYGMVGYYPLSWLYLQYRAGLRTTDNRRGLFLDDRRLDERDRGSHNVTIMGRYRGFYAGLQMFWNLERANELDDDFLRFTVGYEF